MATANSESRVAFEISEMLAAFFGAYAMPNVELMYSHVAGIALVLVTVQ